MRSAALPVPSLYIHVPFCARKCDYCAFYSESAKGELVNRYVNALVRDLAGIAPQFSGETVFFGGGTPSLLNLRQWEFILSSMDRMGFNGVGEWTVECNPATVSEDKARLLREGGVNRISMGVQSLDEELLDRLGRIHSREMVFRSYDILREAGFENINLDLMFAIPGQSLDVWCRTLDEILAMESEHLSCYEVIYEEDTPLFAQLQAGKVEVNEDLSCAMYEMLMEKVHTAGFRQYEIANFARDPEPGLEVPHKACRHNVNYWRGGSYFGAGPSAAGFVGGIRTRNWANTQRYCELVEMGEPTLETSEELSALERAGEIAAFGLRMNAGWPIHSFKEVTGFDLLENWGSETKELIAEGWAVLENDRFRLTPAGLRFADAAAERFLQPFFVRNERKS